MMEASWFKEKLFSSPHQNVNICCRKFELIIIFFKQLKYDKFTFETTDKQKEENKYPSWQTYVADTWRDFCS